MIRTIYTALSGMNAYRQGLDTISNNVANLNTPGFKSGVPLFLDIVNRNAGLAGGGVTVDTSKSSEKQGEFRSTGNPLDAAVDGNGLFILELNGERYFTRAGQFEFDKEGYLVDRESGARVAVATDTQSMTTLNIESERTFPPRATTAVTLSGNLSRTGSVNYELTGVKVIDSAGGSHALVIAFVRNADNPLQWTAEVRESDGDVLGSAQIQFNAEGTPIQMDEPFSVEITPDGLDPFSVQFNLGSAGTFAGVTSLVNDAQSRLQMVRQDGVPYGALTTVAFDERGGITLNYSNGEKRTPATLLLAQFSSPDQLQSIGSSRFVAVSNAKPQLGTAMSGGLGRLVGGQVELSNVELTEQFTDLIIIQRGYQASSQMSSVANEMMQQLLAMGQGR